MFTGLVEGVGTVVRLSSRGGVRVIVLKVPVSFGDLKEGESLSVSGVCLTVVKAGKGEATLEAVPETLKRTSLANLRTGSKVNLERALIGNSRLGGHFVQGHVDGTGKINSIHPAGESREVEIVAGPEIVKYLVEKGSVALDGVSLTVVSAGADSFRMALIPHTLGHTTLASWRIGDEVNIEVDILSKYAERQLKQGGKRVMTPEWLAEQGFK